MDEKKLIESIGELINNKFESLTGYIDKKFEVVDQRLEIINKDVCDLSLRVEKVEENICDLSQCVHKLSCRVTRVELTLENETNRIINLYGEDHDRIEKSINEVHDYLAYKDKVDMIYNNILPDYAERIEAIEKNIALAN
jgi:predicted  nucleic acid-binding Zn-ribbon protein